MLCCVSAMSFCSQWPAFVVEVALTLVVFFFLVVCRSTGGLREDVVDHAVFLGFAGRHVVVAIGVLGDPLERLAGVLRPESG